MKSLKLLFTLLISLVALPLAAQTELSVSVNPSTVSVGQMFEISYSINTNAAGFTPPDFSPFRVAAGPFSSTRMQSINGRSTITVGYSFRLIALAPGDFTIPPATIRTSEGVIKSKPVTVKVVRGAAGSVPPGSSQQQTQQQPQSIPSASEDLFIRATVNKRSAWLGEPVNLIFKVYTRVDLRNVQPRKMPSLTGFWSEDYDLSQQAKFRNEIINGVAYRVADIKRTVLFPQKTGELTIDPLEIDFTIRKRVSTGDPFVDQFFGSFEHEQVTISSPPVKINVKPLPTPQPQNFTGAVGNYSISSSLDRTETKANEAVKLSITVKGTGNLGLINEPALTFPPDIEVYDPETKNQFSSNAYGMQGSRTWEYLLIPRHKGNFKIPVYEFSYFDPSSATYKNLSTGIYELSVLEGDTEGGSAYSSSGYQEKIKELDKDIRFIRENAEFEKERNEITGTFTHMGAIALPLIGFLVFLIITRKREQNQSDIHGNKARKALKESQSRLHHAEKFLKENRKDKFLDEVFHALNNYISHRFAISTGEISREKISELFRNSGISENTTRNYLEVLDEAEFARFSPAGAKDLRSLLERSHSVIKSTESELT